MNRPHRLVRNNPKFSNILQVMLAKENLAEDVDLGIVAARTDGYSGSDLSAVSTAAAMRPVRELLSATGKSAQIKVGQLTNILTLSTLISLN
jgi:SpoVK/Ycf46/Vps4 family AAA+-type ATPase